MQTTRAKDKPAPDGLKITMQYRARRCMVYELRCGEASLDVHIWTQVAEGTPGGWRVEAHESRTAGAVVIGEYGPSPREALHAVGRAWIDSAHDLPQFDWDAIAGLLAGVRAF